MYEYRAWVTKLVDADTMHIGIDLGLDIATQQTIRLYGINAPEMSTEAGKAAKAWAQSWLDQHCPDGRFTLQTFKDRRERYGRYLGAVTAADGAVFNTDIVDAGHAITYIPKLEGPQ